MDKRQVAKLQKAMANITEVVDELDNLENEQGYTEQSYYADKLSYAKSLIEILLEENEKETSK